MDDIDRLRNSVTEVELALGYITSVLAGVLVGADIVKREDLAQRLEFDAQAAGRELASIIGSAEADRPNPYVMKLAAAIRTIGQPLKLVGGTDPPAD